MSLMLSILLPTYNHCDTLSECLTKLENRGFLNNECEVNVSDNGSNDLTKSVCSKFSVNYRRNEINLGFNKNVEALIRVARGKYIIIIGDDDEFLFDWETVKVFLKKEFDLYIFGFEESIFTNSNSTVEKLPLGFIGDCIQKNSSQFKQRFLNYNGKSNSAHFFARIDVLIYPNSIIFFNDSEIVRRFEVPKTNFRSKNILAKIKSFLLRPLDYGYYWFKARSELKNYYSEEISSFWILVIDKAMMFTRKKHLEDSGLFALLYYWFFQLYLRVLFYPSFSFYIFKGVLTAIFTRRSKKIL